jgi:hypothetical protein
MANNKTPKLRAFVRIDGSGRVVSGTPVFQAHKPKVGTWREIPLYYRGVATSTTTSTTTIAGITVKISHDPMLDPVCTTLTTLAIQITSGTSLSDALTITGDFASLGAYYTPVAPGDMMSQPPVFRIAYQSAGVLKTREFRLTAVGVASGSDAMFGTTQESTCI